MPRIQVYIAKAQGRCCPSTSRTRGLANPVAVNHQPSYAVVLKIPKSLDDPNTRKQFLDSVCPDLTELGKLRQLKQDWKFYIKSKSSTKNIVEKMKAIKPEVIAMMKEKLFITALKQVHLT